jgi:hypothetical protein
MRYYNSLRLACHSTACVFWRNLYHFAFEQVIKSERRHCRILCSEMRVKPSQVSR